MALSLGRRSAPGLTFLIFIGLFTATRWSVFYLRAGQSALEQTFYPALYAAVLVATLALAFASTRSREQGK